MAEKTEQLRKRSEDGENPGHDKLDDARVSEAASMTGEAAVVACEALPTPPDTQAVIDDQYGTMDHMGG